MATALFLDRDGVINEEKDGSYIFHKDEFVFYSGAEAALAKLSGQFDYVFIVTNQRGIGRGLMTEAALHEIHDYLTATIELHGGKIHKIYFAPSADSGHSHRKPNTGMALDALNDFPDIEFDKSIMVGNNLSDMKFGKAMGMKTIFLSTTQPAFTLPHELIDEQYDSLKSFAGHL
jgi:histidinol-phosphate phosphatase family protein